MDDERVAPMAGLLSCLLAVIAVLAPYVAVPEQEVGVVGQYYGLGVVSPLAIGLLALVGAIAFAAGLEERSDPTLVAGLMLGIGAFSLFVAVQWVLAVPPTVGQSAGTADFLGTHRWSIPATAGLIAATAIWYARALGLVGGGR